MNWTSYLPQRRAALRLPAPLRRFARAESGAITVDWTVLTGAILGLGIGAAVLVSGGVANLGASIQGALSDATVTLDTDPLGSTDTSLAVDLQTADQELLQQISGIGPVRAAALLAARDEGGLNLNTASRSELESVSGIGPVLAERIIQFRNSG